MIAPPKDLNAHLASAWATGISLLFSGIGLYGAFSPLLPQPEALGGGFPDSATVRIEQFDLPLAPDPEEPAEPEPPPTPEEIEIPPLPDLVSPVDPPEMVELVPLAEAKPTPPRSIEPPPPEPRAAARRSSMQDSSGPTEREAKPGGSRGSSNGGRDRKGSFPQPSYPQAARGSGIQGTVYLRVVVNSSGQPSSVSVVSSSGSAILDAAARDHVRRRWRWPGGQPGTYTVPIRFVLQ